MSQANLPEPRPGYQCRRATAESGGEVRAAVRRLAGALLDDVVNIAGRSVARMQELLPSYAEVPADALIPVTLTNTRNLLEAVRDPDADPSRPDDHFRLSGETRLRQGITADEMLQAWRIGLEVVREEAHPSAMRLGVSNAVLLEFVEATLRWGDIGMRVSAAAHREGEIRELARLAAEQSALRRVATLAASEHSADDLFATLVEELGVLLAVDASAILRYEADSSATVIAGWSSGAVTLPIGERLPLEGESLAGEVYSTGKPRRKERYDDAPGAIAATVRELGFRSAVASPIVVEDATWGVIAVLSRQPEPFPPDTEARVAEFTLQAGIAVANAKSRADLAESRARIIRASDDARRRFERDLHDGAQQRLVSLGLELRAAGTTVPPELGDLRRALSRVGDGLNEVLDDLREMSRGLHPAVLSEGGLTPALRVLARRSAVPVDLRLGVGKERFEDPVEVTAYYVASEALTNIAKHAYASRVEIIATRHEDRLELIVSDDGRGGADASSGTGLTGLVDRVEAIGGTMRIDDGRELGTVIQVNLPITSTVAENPPS